MIVTASGARLGVLSRRALPFQPTGIGVAMTVWYDPTYDDSIASAVQAVCDLKSHPAVLLWLPTVAVVFSRVHRVTPVCRRCSPAASGRLPL